MADKAARDSDEASMGITREYPDVQIPKKKHQMDRSVSRIGVLKFGVVYRGMQNKHLL